MKKVVFFVYLSMSMHLHATNQEDLYQDIRTKINSEVGAISYYLYKQGFRNSTKKIDFLERCKRRAFVDNEPAIFDRLHEEIMYEEKPWYKKSPLMASCITFMVTAFFVITGKPSNHDG